MKAHAGLSGPSFLELPVWTAALEGGAAAAAAAAVESAHATHDRIALGGLGEGPEALEGDDHNLDLRLAHEDEYGIDIAFYSRIPKQRGLIDDESTTKDDREILAPLAVLAPANAESKTYSRSRRDHRRQGDREGVSERLPQIWSPGIDQQMRELRMTAHMLEKRGKAMEVRDNEWGEMRQRSAESISSITDNHSYSHVLAPSVSSDDKN